MKTFAPCLAAALAAVVFPVAGLSGLQPEYSTYLGGSYIDQVMSLAAENGEAYVGGHSRSIDFPTVDPYQAAGGLGDAYDVFVSKFSSAGSQLLFSTYVGGTGSDTNMGLAVLNGETWAAGNTDSRDFPTVDPYQAETDGNDVFLFRLSSSGSRLLYSSYFGGTGMDSGSALALDGGEPYLTGTTYSDNYPIINPYQSTRAGFGDLFVARFSSTGTALIYSTYLGGGSYDSAGYWGGLAVENGEAYLTGSTYSGDFPTVNAYQATGPSGDNEDAIAAKLSSTGSALLYSTYLGGGSEDRGRSLAVEGAEAYITGTTNSTDFPMLSAYQESLASESYTDGFATKISSSGSLLAYSSYLGGAWADSFWGIAVSGGNATVVGETQSSDFPTINPYQGAFLGNTDAVVARFSSSGSRLIFSSRLGGGGNDNAKPVRVAGGQVYTGGDTNSVNFPTVNPYQPTAPGESYGFVCRFAWEPTPPTTPSPEPSASPSPSPSQAPSATPTAAPSATPTPHASPSASPTPEPTKTPPPTATPSPIPPSPTQEPSATPAPPSPTPTTAAPPWIYDYDGDGTSDIAVFRESSGMWSVRNLTRAYFGSSTDGLVPGDYDGDGTTDIAIFRPSSGLWSVKDLTRFYMGSAGDIPIQGDYSGDGTAEGGVFRESSGLWSIRNLTRVYLGSSGDTVIPGWYDADAAKDIAIFRGSSGMWSMRNITRFYLGSSTDELVPGDYNGSGKWEGGIFREATGLWSIRNVTRIYLGSTGDWALPADYNGDGVDDFGIFRESANLWSVRNLTRVYFGATGDIPVTR